MCYSLSESFKVSEVSKFQGPLRSGKTLKPCNFATLKPALLRIAEDEPEKSAIKIMASFSRKRKRGNRMQIQLAAESHVPCFQERVGTSIPGYMIPDRLPWRLRARPSATLHEIQVRSRFSAGANLFR